VLAQLLPDLRRLGGGVLGRLGLGHEGEIKAHEVDGLACGHGARLEAPAPAPHALGRAERHPLDAHDPDRPVIVLDGDPSHFIHHGRFVARNGRGRRQKECE
jgi:hypothetical protein